MRSPPAGLACAPSFSPFSSPVGIILATDIPDDDAPDADWAKYVNDSGRLVENIVGAYLLIAASLALLVVIIFLFQRFRAADGGDAGWSWVMLAAGVGFAVLASVGAVGVTMIALSQKIGSSPPPDPALAKQIPQFGYAALLLSGALFGALMTLLTSLLVLRTKALPAWVGYSGFVATLGLIGAVVFVPMILFVLWMLALGIVLVLRGESLPMAAKA